jgi:hypothetical protein
MFCSVAARGERGVGSDLSEQQPLSTPTATMQVRIYPNK